MEEQQIKTVFVTDIRRFAIPLKCDYSELATKIKNLYNFGPQVSITMKYQDEENDLITFSSNNEFQFALALFRNKIFRIIVEKVSQELSTFPPTTANQPTLPTPPLVTPTASVTPTPTPKAYQPPHQRSYHSYDHWKPHHQPSESKPSHWDYHHVPRPTVPTPFDGGNMQIEEKPLGKQGGRFIKHLTIEDDTILPPNTPFLKAWRFRNESNKPWPDNCNIVFVGKKHGDLLGAASETIPVNNKNGPQPNEEINICVNLVTPNKPGKYVGYWRLAEPSGKKFGQRVRVQVHVSTDAYANTPGLFLNPMPLGNLNYALFPSSNAPSTPTLFPPLNATNASTNQPQDPTNPTYPQLPNFY